MLKSNRTIRNIRNRPALTEDPVPTVLLRLALPMIAVSLGIILFNLTDTYFVGRLGAVPLAALSFTFPVVLFSGSITMGLGMGTSVTVSHALGARSHHLASRLTTDALLLTALMGLVIMSVGLLTIEPLFTLLGAEENVLPLIRRYMTIWYAGMPLIVLSMVAMQVVQAGGDTRTPSILMIASVILNIVLDPVLIFGIGPLPALGITGAAIATVFARSLSLVFVLLIVGRREKLFTLQNAGMERFIRSWRRILHIGIPAAAVNALQPLSMGIITRLVAAHGVLPVAGFGVATRIETFALILIIAISMVLTPFTGQNAGANKPGRIQEGMRYATLFSLGWSVVTFAVFMTAARPLAAVFNEADEVVAVASLYLKIMAVSYGFQGAVRIANAAFNGLHMPWTATALAFTRMFVLYVPLAWAGSVLFGLAGLFGGAAIANLLSGVLAFVWFERRISRKKARANQEQPSTSGTAPQA